MIVIIMILHIYPLPFFFPFSPFNDKIVWQPPKIIEIIKILRLLCHGHGLYSERTSFASLIVTHVGP